MCRRAFLAPTVNWEDRRRNMHTNHDRFRAVRTDAYSTRAELGCLRGSAPERADWTEVQQPERPHSRFQFRNFAGKLRLMRRRMQMVRNVLQIAPLLLIGFSFGSSGGYFPADFPVCAVYGDISLSAKACRFTNFADCRASVAGLGRGGYCERNAEYRPRRSPRR
jgi:hypothetical protein